MSTATETVERSEGRQGLASMIRRVKIRNYKSIKNCDVELGPFTILVGRNGAGKSNFLDAIRLVSEGLSHPHGWPEYERPDSASNRAYPWSGLNRWVKQSGPMPGPATFELSLELALPCGEAVYEVALRPWKIEETGDVIRNIYGVVVERERLEVRDGDGSTAFFECAEERLVGSSEPVPEPVDHSHLLLAQMRQITRFEPVLRALSEMSFHDLRPDAMRRGPVGASQPLARDGANLTTVLMDHRMMGWDTSERIAEWLRVIVPGISGIQLSNSAPHAELIFEQGNGSPSASYGLSIQGVSDGTLRALGILVAINQLASDGRPIRLVGIEEPETALHPAAAGALMDAFRDAASHTQVLVTTHGADLLDRFDPEEDHILAVEYRDGRTEIGPVNPASRDAIREHLFSAGELLRMDQLHPDRLDVARQAASDPVAPDGGS